MEDCPLCGQQTYKASTRLIKDACGHTKCRLCLLQEENGCSICKDEKNYTSTNNSNKKFEIPNYENQVPFEHVNKISEKSSHISCLTISRTCTVKKNYLNIKTKQSDETENDCDNIKNNNSFVNDITEKEIINEEEINKYTSIIEHEEIDQLKTASVEVVTDKSHFSEENINNTQNVKQLVKEKRKENCVHLNAASLLDKNTFKPENIFVINQLEDIQKETSDYNQLNKTYNYSLSNKSPDFRLSDYLSFKNSNEEIAQNESIANSNQLFGYKSPDFQLSDYILLKKKSTTQENTIDTLKENKCAKSDHYKVDMASPSLVINLNSDNCCYPLNTLPDKRIMITTREKEQPSDERVNYDHLKCFEFPSYSAIEKKLRSNENLSDKIETNHSKKTDDSIISSLECAITGSDNVESSKYSLSEKILKTNENLKVDMNQKKKVEDDEDKENKEKYEKKGKEFIVKEGNKRDVVSFSSVNLGNCRIKDQIQKDQNNEIVKPKESSFNKQKCKKIKQQNKKHDSQITIQKGKNKRKTKVLFFDEDFEADVKRVVPKRRRQGKDWSHIVTLTGGTVAYKCTICEKIFKSLRGKWYHASCPSGELPFRCHVCPRTFVKRSHFEYHERMHSGHKPFKCNVCDKSFVQKSKLNRHVLIHKQQNDIECAECGRRFSTKQYLKNHMSIHQNNSYKCKFCPKTFTLAFNRKRHERSHSNDRPYKCDICSKDFKGKFLLTRHRRTHDKSRPFSCHDCHRVFLSKFEVQRHMSIHSDVKPYSCHQCNLEFRRKDNLNRHIKHHHSLDCDSLKTVKNDDNIGKNDNDEAKSTDKEKQSKRNMKPNDNMEKPTNSIKLKTKTRRISRTILASSVKNSLKISMGTPQSYRQMNSKHDFSNAVPVIRGPISIKRFDDGSEITGARLGFTEPISLEEAVVLNRKIEEKIYTQDSFFNYPGLNRRTNPMVKRRDSCGSNSNSNSNDDTGFANKQITERSKTVYFGKDEQSIVLKIDETKAVKDINLHWRRRTAESLKSNIAKCK